MGYEASYNLISFQIIKISGDMVEQPKQQSKYTAL